MYLFINSVYIEEQPLGNIFYDPMTKLDMDRDNPEIRKQK